MGLVHIYCGDGKGKTSAAIGLAVRAAGSGRRVVIARFLKTDNSGEVEILKRLPEVTLIPCRKNFGFVRSMDEETKKECADYNRNLFLEAVELAKTADLVVFDEIMAAVNYGMVPGKGHPGFSGKTGRKRASRMGWKLSLRGGTRRSRCLGRRTMCRRSARESIRLTRESWHDAE